MPFPSDPEPPPLPPPPSSVHPTDYMCDLVLHGLKTLLESRGGQVVDAPRRHHAYLYPEDQPPLTTEHIYG